MTSWQAAVLCYLGVAASACAATPASYVGAQKCQACHPVQFTSQSASAHAAALSPVSDHKNFPAGMKFTRDPQYRYEILVADSGLRVHIDDGADLMDLPLEWVFGAGRQAST